MQKFLMVCLGNICRSPVAEGVLRDLIKKNNLNAWVDSAATSSNHIGESPDKRSQANALKNGLNITDLRARQFKQTDFDAFDFIYVMDSNNYRDVISLARNESDKEKVKLLLNEIYPGQNKAVPDPYFGGEQGFQEVFELVTAACTQIADRIK